MELLSTLVFVLATSIACHALDLSQLNGNGEAQRWGGGSIAQQVGPQQAYVPPVQQKQVVQHQLAIGPDGRAIGIDANAKDGLNNNVGLKSLKIEKSGGVESAGAQGNSDIGKIGAPKMESRFNKSKYDDSDEEDVDKRKKIKKSWRKSKGKNYNIDDDGNTYSRRSVKNINYNSDDKRQANRNAKRKHNKSDEDSQRRNRRRKPKESQEESEEDSDEDRNRTRKNRNSKKNRDSQEKRKYGGKGGKRNNGKQGGKKSRKGTTAVEVDVHH